MSSLIGLVSLETRSKVESKQQRLQDYKRECGDCDVPQGLENHEKPCLGRWVNTYRQLYRKGLLPEERTIQLEQMNTTWKVRDAGQYFNDENGIIAMT